jgi:hypothetical protein
LVVAVESTEVCNLNFEIRLSMSGKDIATAKGEIFFEAGGLVLVTLLHLPVPIGEAGELAFTAKLADGEWVELWKGPVKLATQPGTAT